MASSGRTDSTTPFLSAALYGATLDSLPTTTPPPPPPPTTTSRFNSLRTQTLRHASRFLRRTTTSRRLMREPSMVVREAAAAQIEERQTEWVYSRPVVVMDALWNLGFVVVAAVVLGLSWDEKPGVPVRVWVAGYGVLCGLHVGCVVWEYRRRRRRGRGVGVEEGEVGMWRSDEDESSPVTRHLESANTMLSIVWWVIGFYWIFTGGQTLQQDSPQLYWLCIVFLAFDAIFMAFCVALASIIAVAVCCCLPCIIGILYALADRAGASREDIEQLTKYKFQRVDGEEKKLGDMQSSLGDMQSSSGGIMIECGKKSPIQRRLSTEDAECCICLTAYDHGIELREMPCGHHFHSACIEKWLYINSTCPLCKYDISKGSHEAEV
ncbi:hypothetical protein Drorol1_Dr00025165 [Drosera rotundifolia]